MLPTPNLTEEKQVYQSKSTGYGAIVRVTGFTTHRTAEAL